MRGKPMTVEEVRDKLRRPPCWGPNEQGEYMVDMAVGAYEADLDAMLRAARSTTDDLRAQLAATEIKLAAARLALAACREVREARDA